MSNVLKLILAIALPLAVGATSGFFTVTGVESWYQTIQKPPGTRLAGFLVLYGQHFMF